ncbi:MAG: hypothetical protein QM215_00465, partial [Bacillota bacterium]|nr:hypothetical protein [Bacillota bacterium]
MLDKNLMAIHLTDCDDEEARIVARSGARGEEVSHSVVAGKIVMKDRKLVNIDEKDYLEAVKDRHEGIGKRA